MKEKNNDIGRTEKSIFQVEEWNASKDILSLVSFLQAVKFFREKEQLLKSKSKNQSLIELGNIGKFERIKLKNIMNQQNRLKKEK